MEVVAASDAASTRNGAAGSETAEQHGPVTEGAKAAFVRSCIAYAEAERARLQGEVRARAEQVSELSAQLRAAGRSLHAARQQLSALEAALVGERVQLEEDFDQLGSLPRVRAVEVEGSLVRVLTDAIAIEHGGQRYRIGEFALELDLERGVRVVNLNNTGHKSGWDHPHVQAGLPCLGNLRSGFEKLLGECQLVPLTSMLVQFLETYNPETAYCSIELWERMEA